MISGPVFPRTREGLWGLIERHLDAIESGLTLVERDLELEPGCAVDALAKDAAGRPVFLFTVDPQNDRDLPARVLATHAWLSSGLALLARFAPREGLDYELPPRMVSVGFEIPPPVLTQLAELGAAGVEAYQIRTMRIAGHIRVGVVPLVGAGVVGEEDSFRLPGGVREPKMRTLCVRFMDLMQRLEPDLRVTGDRYSRRFSFSSCLLAELRLRDGVVRVRVPDGKSEESGAAGSAPHDGGGLELRSLDDCREVIDRVMRRYLGVLGAGRSAASRVPEAESCPGAPSQENDSPLPFERLRQTVDTSLLSVEEYSAFGESSPDDS